MQNPILNDISGEWEASGPMPYAKLVIAQNKSNYMVVVQNEKEIEIYELKSFKSLANGFECEIVSINKNKKLEKMNGAVILNRVVLSPANDETTKIWFIRSRDLAKYQGIANTELEKHNNANQH